MEETRTLAEIFFTDCETDSRTPNEESLSAWLWFTCPAHLREKVKLTIKADNRFRPDIDGD